MRRRPKVRFPRAGRRTSRSTISESSSAPASTSMCAASERSASESARMPATTSATMNATISASPMPSRRASAPSCDRVDVTGVAVVRDCGRVRSRRRLSGFGGLRRRLTARVRRDLATRRAEDAAAERHRAAGAAGRAGRGRRRRPRPRCHAPHLPCAVVVLRCSWSAVISARGHWPLDRSDRTSRSVRCGLVILDGHNDLALRVWLGEEPAHIDLATAAEADFAGGFFALSLPGAAVRDPAARRRTRCRSTSRSGHDEARARGRRRWPACSRGSTSRSSARVDEIVPGRVNAIMHLEGAEPLAPDLSDLDELVRPRPPLGRDHLVAAERVRRGRAVPLPVVARHRPRADRGGPRPGARLQPPRDPRRRLAPERGRLLGCRPGHPGAARRDATRTPTRSAPSSRNLTDRQLDAIGESGGVVGVNFGAMFLRADGTRDTGRPARRRSSRHIDYIACADRRRPRRVRLRLRGRRRSRTSSAASPACRGSSRRSARAGYDDEAIAKITHGNWLRVLGETWRRWGRYFRLRRHRRAADAARRGRALRRARARRRPRRRHGPRHRRAAAARLARDRDRRRAGGDRPARRARRARRRPARDAGRAASRTTTWPAVRPPERELRAPVLPRRGRSRALWERIVDSIVPGGRFCRPVLRRRTTTGRGPGSLVHTRAEVERAAGAVRDREPRRVRRRGADDGRQDEALAPLPRGRAQAVGTVGPCASGTSFPGSTVSVVGVGCNNFGWRLDAAADAGGRRRGDRRRDHAVRHRRELRRRRERGVPRPRARRAARPRRDRDQVRVGEGPRRQLDRPRRIPTTSARAIEGSLRAARHRLRRPLPVPPARRRHADRGDARRDERARRRGQGALHRLVELLGRAGRGGRRGRRPTRGFARFVTAQNQLLVARARGRGRADPGAASGSGSRFIPYFPLASGLLTGKYRRGAPEPDGDAALGPARGLRRAVVADRGARGVRGASAGCRCSTSRSAASRRSRRSAR